MEISDKVAYLLAATSVLVPIGTAAIGYYIGRKKGKAEGAVEREVLKTQIPRAVQKFVKALRSPESPENDMKMRLIRNLSEKTPTQDCGNGETI